MAVNPVVDTTAVFHMAGAPTRLRIHVKRRSRLQLLTAALLGALVGLLALITSRTAFAPSLAWDAAAISFLLLKWRDIWRLDGERTKDIAADEDSSSLLDDIILIVAALIGLATVVLVLSNQATGGKEEAVIRTIIGVVSVVLAWAIVHTVYTLKYARLYYAEPEGGIEFNTPELPSYADFAYVAFGIGMAFQVADTNLQTRTFRIMVLGHALLSFLFATTILAVTINLVAGLNA